MPAVTRTLVAASPVTRTGSARDDDLMSGRWPSKRSSCRPGTRLSCSRAAAHPPITVRAGRVAATTATRTSGAPGSRSARTWTSRRTRVKPPERSCHREMPSSRARAADSTPSDAGSVTEPGSPRGRRSGAEVVAACAPALATVTCARPPTEPPSSGARGRGNPSKGAPWRHRAPLEGRGKVSRPSGGTRGPGARRCRPRARRRARSTPRRPPRSPRARRTRGRARPAGRRGRPSRAGGS